MSEVHVLGIRHHGPGSARSVIQALSQLHPDCVLIEGPPEMDDLIRFVGDPGLVPPVAALVYDQMKPSCASFYPLAEFSPEWVALKWAVSEGCKVRFIDLPAKHRFALDAADQPGDDGQEDFGEAVGGDSDEMSTGDPIAQLATAAGYDDPERWWEDAVEQRHEGVLDRFAAIREAIAAIREREEEILEADSDAASTMPKRHGENELREAAMRRELRAELKGGAKRVVVVCGAWHSPALFPLSPAAPDNRILAKLPKTKVAAAWVPWSAGRLSYESGYGAGVRAPGWYQHLFRHMETGAVSDVGTTWLVRVAHALRAEGVDASTASVVDAARLASTLASLRGRPSPGLSELDDAALAVLVDGNPAPLALVHKRVVVGEELGSVPDSAPVVPLAADLARQQKKYRLKVSAAAQTITLDLRTPSGLGKSVLLHRMQLLGLPWGRQVHAGQTKGTFKEAWQLEWTPELSIALVEASIFGTTVALAAKARSAQLAMEASSLSVLSELVLSCLVAELPVDEIVQSLAKRAAVGSDVIEMLDSIDPLARICRYGTVRGESSKQVQEILSAIALRGTIGLPAAASGADDESAVRLYKAVDSANNGLSLLGNDELLTVWWATLEGIAKRDHIPGALAGGAAKILLESGHFENGEVAILMGRWLSSATPPKQAASWLDGLLSGGAALLIHDHTLLGLVDEWVKTVSPETFDDVLPLVRRTFSAFEPAERRAIGGQLNSGGSLDGDTGLSADIEQARGAITTVTKLLGWKDAS